MPDHGDEVVEQALGVEYQLLVPCRPALGDRARLGQLVPLSLAGAGKADREGARRQPALRKKADDARRIEPARQRAGDRHVRKAPAFDGRAQRLAKPPRPFGSGCAVVGADRRTPPALDRDLAVGEAVAEALARAEAL